MKSLGCYVNLASSETRPKTLEVRVIVALQVLRGIIFIILGIFSAISLPLFAGIALIDFLLAGWLWTLRIESWGLAVGFSIFYIIYPLSLAVSAAAYLSVLVLVEMELVLLFRVRSKGYYNFNTLSRMEPIDSFNASTIQRTMFNLVIMAQLFKTLFMFFGISAILSYEALYGPQLWFGVPQVPIALILLAIDLIAAFGFILHRDWGFHLILVTAALSFTETVLTWSFPTVLVGIWIITLMMPCWAKWGFYAGLLRRYRDSREFREISGSSASTSKK